MKKKPLVPLGLTLALLALAVILGLRAVQARRAWGWTDIETVGVTADGGAVSGTLYTPVIAVKRDPVPAVLLLGLGQRADRWASELSRRGYVTLAVEDASAARAAWDWLAEQENVLPFCMGLCCGAEAFGSGAALAAALAGEESAPRTVIFLDGSPEASGSAAPLSAAQNRLWLLSAAPEDSALSAFLDADAGAEIGRTLGYFGEGSARRAELLPEDDRERSAFLSAVDWLGSSLGHPVTLSDDDLLWGARKGLRLGAVVCAALSPAPLLRALLRRRKTI